MRFVTVIVAIAAIILYPLTAAAAIPTTRNALDRQIYLASGPPTPMPPPEVLKGAGAANHLRNLKAKHKDAFDKAEKLLRDRGWVPTEIIGVVRSSSTIQLIESDATGEITAWAWDDGDPSTWEGTVYVELYGEGWVTFNTQILIAPQEQLWNEPTGYFDAREPLNLEAALTSDGAPVQLASLNQDDSGAIRLVLQAPSHRSVQEKVADWATCAFFGCLGAAVGCIVMGPAWFPCTIVGCWIAYISCAQTLFEP